MQATNQNTQPSDDANHLAEIANGPHSTQGTASQYWLSIQCSMIQDISRGLLFSIPNESKHVNLEAYWPKPVAAQEALAKKVRTTADRNKTFIEKREATADAAAMLRLYQPLTVSGETETQLVVVLEMSDRNKAQTKTVINLLNWNTEWLKFAITNIPPASIPNLSAVFSMAVTCLDQKDFRATAMALVTELTSRFGCQRVTLGLREGKRTQVQVLSHSARFKHETNLIQAIGAAMDEAIDQDRVINYPVDGPQNAAIIHAHAQLASQTPNGQVCTVPITDRGRIFGALTLEHESDEPLDATAIALIEQLADIVAPALALKHKDEQALPIKAWHSLRKTTNRLFGPAHIKLKLAAAVCLSALFFFSVTQGDWRVTADAVVEGSVQRTVAAPIDGYIASVEARAGDVVTAQQQMGSLDDSDLRLQRLKWSTLRQQMVSESREAMAGHKRAEVSIVNAKIDQADAELKLIDEQLSRTRLLAPFDGIVIEGDLSQLLGTPVTRGDTLFKVAPLKGYRIVLKVDEKDIAPIAPGQSGKLILASMPNRTLELQVDKITPVSNAEGGRNFFRVEASLLDIDLPLQPGMEGVGKILVGEANLFWIWTRDLSNWLRLQTWTWWR